MTKWLAMLAMALVCGWTSAQRCRAEEYKVEAVEGAPKELNAKIAEKIDGKGFKVLKPDGKTVLCEVWFAKEFQAAEQPIAGATFNIAPGSVVGALRLPAEGADIRGQSLPGGVYTLRYGVQPDDGNHAGSFPSRDFLVLLPSADDKDPAPAEEGSLQQASMKAINTQHPAVIGMLAANEGTAPSMHQHKDDEHDWWSLLIDGKLEKAGTMPFELILVGKVDH